MRQTFNYQMANFSEREKPKIRGKVCGQCENKAALLVRTLYWDTGIELTRGLRYFPNLPCSGSSILFLCDPYCEVCTLYTLGWSVPAAGEGQHGTEMPPLAPGWGTAWTCPLCLGSCLSAHTHATIFSTYNPTQNVCSSHSPLTPTSPSVSLVVTLEESVILAVTIFSPLILSLSLF